MYSFFVQFFNSFVQFRSRSINKKTYFLSVKKSHPLLNEWLLVQNRIERILSHNFFQIKKTCLTSEFKFVTNQKQRLRLFCVLYCQ